MITEDQILTKLDNYKFGYYCQFIDLGHPYSYFIDSRLNIFKGDNNKWVIAAERLGYNPRSGGIMLDIYYFGNCLINLEHYNGQDTNSYTVLPIDWNDFTDTVDGEALKTNAKFWNIRGKQIGLTHDKQDYLNKEIELNEYGLGKISLQADVLVSWNFKHIVNLDKIRGYKGINYQLGYSMIEIRTPKEIINYEDTNA